MPSAAQALIATVALIAVHVSIGRMRFLEGPWRRPLLSFGGGISVAYVFIHLLPEIAHGQQQLTERSNGELPFIEHQAYLMALLGLALFYGLERGAVVSRRGHQGESGPTDSTFFAIHLGAFAAYSMLTGYLLVRRAEDTNGWDLALFTIALAVHFIVNDQGLRVHHQHQYRDLGRWILAGALGGGWALGAMTELSDAGVAVLLALLGGAIVLNVLKEELPAERDSRFWAFALGAGTYSGLLVLI